MSDWPNKYRDLTDTSGVAVADTHPVYDKNSDKFVGFPSFSKMESFGHSLVAAGGTDTPYADKGHPARIAAKLGLWLNDYSKGGARLTRQESGGSAAAGNGGWSRVLNTLLPLNTAAYGSATWENGYFGPKSDLVYFGFGLNDVPQYGPSAANLEPFRRAYRAIIRRARASVVFEDSDASVTYTGTWTHATGATTSGNFNSSNGDYSWSTTVNDHLSIAVPLVYPGNLPITLGFIASLTPTDGALIQIAVDGVNVGTLDTRNSVPQAFTGGSSELPVFTYTLNGLSAGAHTITATILAVGGTGAGFNGCMFDYWQIEAQTLPFVVIQQQPHLPDAAYHNTWQTSPYPRNNTTVSADVAVGSNVVPITSIQPYAANGVRAIMAGDTFTLEEHTANQETFTVGSINGTNITLANGAVTRIFHANNSPVSVGYQDADVDVLRGIIAGVVAEFDGHVKLVDPDTVLNKNTALFASDVTHPNSHGHALQAQQFYGLLLDSADLLNGNNGLDQWDRSRSSLHADIWRTLVRDPDYSDSASDYGHNTITPKRTDIPAIAVVEAPATTNNQLSVRNSAGTLLANIDQYGNLISWSAGSGQQTWIGNKYGVPAVAMGGTYGDLGLYRISAGTLLIQADTVAQTQVQIKEEASQSADAFEIINSAGAVVSRVDMVGNVYGSNNFATQVYIGNSYGVASVAFNTPPDLRLYRIAAGTLLIQQDNNVAQTQVQIKQAASQSADIKQTMNSAGTVLHKVDSSGNIYAANTTSGQVFIGNSSGFAAIQFGNTSGSQTFLFQDSAGSLTIAPPSGTVQSRLIIKGGSTQTNDLQQFMNSSGTVLSRFTSSGTFQVSSLAYWIGATGSPAGGLRATSIGIGAAGPQVTSPLLLISANNASDIPLVTKAAATPTGDQQQWQNSDGSTASRVSAGGILALRTNYLGSPQATLSVSPSSAGAPAIIAQAVASQTGNIQEWRSSAGTVLTKVDSAGNVTAPKYSLSTPPAARTMTNWTSAANSLRAIDRNNFTLQNLFDFVMTNIADLQTAGLFT